MSQQKVLATAVAATSTGVEAVGGGAWFSMKASANNSLNLSIYDEIGFWGVTGADFKRSLDGFDNVSEINVSLHSPGGSVFDGLAIYNQLKNHPAPVNVHIDGMAASIAAVIAMAGDSITIPENAFLMIHKASMSGGGTADSLRDDADLLDKVDHTQIAVFRTKTGLPDADLLAMLAAETWLTGVEAVEMGFADTLAEPVAVAASFQSQIKLRLPMPKNTNEGSTTAPTPAPVIAATAENTRKAEINAVFKGHDDYAELRDACVDDMSVTARDAGDKLLVAIGAGKTPSAGVVHGHISNGRVIHDGMTDALSARVGLSSLDDKQNYYRGMTLMELARASLTEAGVSVASMGGRMDIVAAAFTHSTGDFTSVLENVANKALLTGWDASGETFDIWTKKSELWDFKEAKRAGLGSMPSLPEIKEGSEYRYVSTDGHSIPIALATYGGMFSLTRQAIINDDLSAFDRVPQALGRAAHRTIGDLVYAVLTGNAKYPADNKALFHSDHNNIVTGAFGIPTLDAARIKMRTQKDAQGERLSIEPGFLIVPAEVESAAYTLINSTSPGDATNSGVISPVHKAAQVIVESRLDDASATTKYLVASRGSDTIEVAYLDGIDRPTLESKQGWDVDGTSWKVRIDAGVAPLDYRGMVRLSDS